jgi:Spy/CpxP family protein refolding chaperone
VTKLVVIFGFIVAFAAGLMVGLATRTAGVASPVAPASPTTRPGGGRGGPGGFLIRELALSPQQAEQLRKIWSASPGPRDFDERRGELRRRRDDAVAALFSPADKARYDDIQKTYKQQGDALERQMRASFDGKVQQTKQILTPEQRAKYEDIVKRHQSDRGPRGRGGHDGPPGGNAGRRGEERAASRPAPTTAPPPTAVHP